MLLSNEKNYAAKARDDLNTQKLKFLSRFLDCPYHPDSNLTAIYATRETSRHEPPTIFQKYSSPGWEKDSHDLFRSFSLSLFPRGTGSLHLASRQNVGDGI